MKRKKSRLSKEKQIFSLISEQAASNQSIKSFCNAHNIRTGIWFYWQKKYQQRKSLANIDNNNFTLLLENN
jgi:hypothetical protein